MKTIHMPGLGVGQTEGTLLAWLKQPGDSLTAGEPIAEIETDKAVLDLESPVTGWLSRQLVPAGSTVPVGTILGEVREEADAAAEGSPVAEGPEVELSLETAETPEEPGRSGVQEPAAHTSSAAVAVGSGRVPHSLSPRQRRALADAATSDGNEEQNTLPWTSGKYRATIGRLVAASWASIPHFAVVRAVDAEQLLATIAELRTRTNDVTVTDLLLKALGQALRDRGASGPVPIGLAVATPDGVLVPTIEDTSGPVTAISAQRASAVGRARSGAWSSDPSEHRPLATLSNLGPNGVDQFTGIIASGQQALLTVGRIAPRAVVSATDGSIVVRRQFTATLNVDHRMIDGDVAAGLLVAFAEACESAD
jgi:pyruvate dehydrogenase E2 component (dihydrolipoamide acetyltransferase)